MGIASDICPSAASTFQQSELPERIGQIIAQVAMRNPEQASTMNSVIAPILAPRFADETNIANWHLSKLTSDGYPFEVTFTDIGEDIRCTMEVASHEIALNARLIEAVNAASKVDGIAVCSQTISWMKGLQAGGSLKFGAWIGLKFDPMGGVKSKIYVEVPPEAQERAIGQICDQIGSKLSLPMRQKELRMIGFTPGDDSIEAYFSIHDLRPWELGALMSPLDLHHLAPKVLDRFEAVLRRHLLQTMPSPVFGFSYAFGPKLPPVFSLYSFTEHLFGADAITRRKILSLMERSGKNLEFYPELSIPLEHERETAHGHGLFGVAISKKGGPVIHLGLRPPKIEGDCHA